MILKWGHQLATFTIELSEVISNTPKSTTRDAYIGLDSYPVFEADYRGPLNDKIVNHFYGQEIGQESVDMWRFAMRRKMAEVMPYYNKLYLSEQIQFDPLATVDLKTVNDTVTEQTSEGTSENVTNTVSDNSSRAVNSNTPQVMLRGDGDYATSAADSNSQATGDATGEETSNARSDALANSDTRTTGYQGIASQLLVAYRQSLMNIDMMVITELESMFMQVWNNGDEYSSRERFFL